MNNGKKDDDDEITLVAPPPMPKSPDEHSEILICYNLGDPMLLEETVKGAISNFEKVRDITEQLKLSLDELMLEKYSSFNIPPTNAYEMRDLILKIVKENMKDLKEFNELNTKRNSLLEKLNHCDPIEPDLKAILELYPKIKEDPNFFSTKEKIRMFLSDISVMVNYDLLFNEESKKLAYECVKQYDRIDESIEYLKKIISDFETKSLTEAEEYTLSKQVLQTLLQMNSQKLKIQQKTESNISDKRIKEMLIFIKDNQEMDFTNINFDEMEKYKILNSYVNLKNLLVSCLHNSMSVKNMEEIALKVTEDSLKGKKTSYNNLVKLLVNENIPFVSSELVKKNKKDMEEKLEKLNDACYFQARIYREEKSWKKRAKILIASATLFSLGVIGYVNNAHVSVPEYTEQKVVMTKQLYEDKKDAIKKMEKEVLTSVSNKRLTLENTFYNLSEFKDEKIQKIKDKKDKLIEKKNKIKQILSE